MLPMGDNFACKTELEEVQSISLISEKPAPAAYNAEKSNFGGSHEIENTI